MNGILTTMFIVTSPLNVGQMIQDVRNWESERTRTPAQESINKALDLWEDEDGSDGSTVEEELLQLPSGEDRQSGGWGHDRCDHRPWFRFIQKRTGKDCGS